MVNSNDIPTPPVIPPTNIPSPALAAIVKEREESREKIADPIVERKFKKLSARLVVLANWQSTSGKDFSRSIQVVREKIEALLA